MNAKYRNFGILCCFAVLITILSYSCGSAEAYRSCEGVVWGTTYHIVYRSDKSLDDAAIDAMRRVEMSLSVFCDSSLVSQINRNETDEVDDMFIHIFNMSKQVNSLSGGMFDPTVSPLVNLWGFGYKNDPGNPSQEQIDSALAVVGIQNCIIANRCIVKPFDDTEFNFSAIAKGYGCDVVAEALRRNGCHDYIVEIGGEIVVAGRSPRGGSWNVAIDAPIESADTIVHERMAMIAVDSCAVATSGNYRNYRLTDSGKVSHTLSPITGYPVETSTLSVTVVAPSCALADALATACMAMDGDRAKAMIERLDGVSALFVSADSTGRLQMSPTSRFPAIK